MPLLFWNPYTSLTLTHHPQNLNCVDIDLLLSLQSVSQHDINRGKELSSAFYYQIQREGVGWRKYNLILANLSSRHAISMLLVRGKNMVHYTHQNMHTADRPQPHESPYWQSMGGAKYRDRARESVRQIRQVTPKGLPAIFRSRIFRQIASAFRNGQLSTFAEKLLKNLYSRIVDILRCILDMVRGCFAVVEYQTHKFTATCACKVFDRTGNYRLCLPNRTTAARVLINSNNSRRTACEWFFITVTLSLLHATQAAAASENG